MLYTSYRFICLCSLMFFFQFQNFRIVALTEWQMKSNCNIGIQYLYFFFCSLFLENSLFSSLLFILFSFFPFILNNKKNVFFCNDTNEMNFLCEISIQFTFNSHFKWSTREKCKKKHSIHLFSFKLYDE